MGSPLPPIVGHAKGKAAFAETPTVLSQLDNVGVSPAMTSVKRPLVKSPSPLDSEDSRVPSCPLNLMTLGWAVTLWQNFGQDTTSLNVQNALTSPGW